jgi:hypothetical protein
MKEWARHEIELAIEHEKATAHPDELDLIGYSEACYRSALKAYESLCDDGHSGMSFAFTSSILRKLMAEQPLTPIEDIPENWNVLEDRNGHESYQCRRLYSLFKDVDKATGQVSYHDTDRFICYDNSGISWTNGFVSRKMKELYPITFPYMPEGRYRILAKDFAMSAVPGEFDTMEIKQVTEPDGSVKILNWYFKEVGNGFEQISAEEFQERYATYKKNLEVLNKIRENDT